ncbi:MAG: hypothetical protein ACYDBJ_26805 [Aggregatilineales bacterium]
MKFDDPTVQAAVIAAIVASVISPIFQTISFYANKWFEARTQRQEQRREAIRLALEWIDPLENGLMKAGLIASSFLNGLMANDEVVRRWPDLAAELAPKTLPPHLRVFLPSSLSTRDRQIVLKLQDLQNLVLATPTSVGKVKVNTTEEWAKIFNALVEYIHSIRLDLEKFQQDLAKEYKKTFKP